MYKQNMALNDSRGSICHETQIINFNSVQTINRNIWNHFRKCKQMGSRGLKMLAITINLQIILSIYLSIYL